MFVCFLRAVDVLRFVFSGRRKCSRFRDEDDSLSFSGTLIRGYRVEPIVEVEDPRTVVQEMGGKDGEVGRERSNASSRTCEGGGRPSCSVRLSFANRKTGLVEP